MTSDASGHDHDEIPYEQAREELAAKAEAIARAAAVLPEAVGPARHR